MEQVCPLCNGLRQIETYCPRCGHRLTDGGTLQDFFGPYSPYEERNTYGDLASFAEAGQCVHLFFCPDCDYDQRTAIQQVCIGARD
jgi:hypothetical protein